YVRDDKGYRFQFARGWVETLHLFQVTPAFAEEFNRNPIFRLLRNLSILEQDYEDSGLPVLVTSPHLTHLRRFQLGPDPQDSCHMSGESADALLEKMPYLEELRLYAHQVNVDRVFAMPFPHLRTLVVYHL